MPLPKPNKRENRGDFVSRCIQELNDKGEMKDNNQRIAVCYTQWKEAKAAASAVVGSGDNEVIFSAEKYAGKTRSELKDSDFLYPQERSFPIVTPQDVKDAVSSFGRSKGKDFEDFKRRLVQKARSKGAEFISALPDTIKEQFKIKANSEESVSELQQEYITEAKSIILELLDSANEISILLDDPLCGEKATETWVFEKMVLSNAMINSIKGYLKFNKEEKEEETKETETSEESEESEETMSRENTGLIQPIKVLKVLSENETRQKVYNNKFGADTY